MKRHGRALNVWIDLTWAGFPPLAMLSVVLDWDAVAQVALMTLSFGSVLGTRIALADRPPWDRVRARRQAPVPRRRPHA